MLLTLIKGKYTWSKEVFKIITNTSLLVEHSGLVQVSWTTDTNSDCIHILVGIVSELNSDAPSRIGSDKSTTPLAYDSEACRIGCRLELLVVQLSASDKHFPHLGI